VTVTMLYLTTYITGISHCTVTKGWKFRVGYMIIVPLGKLISARFYHHSVLTRVPLKLVHKNRFIFKKKEKSNYFLLQVDIAITC
jgi:hypothetical protein